MAKEESCWTWRGCPCQIAQHFRMPCCQRTHNHAGAWHSASAFSVCSKHFINIPSDTLTIPFLHCRTTLRLVQNAVASVFAGTPCVAHIHPTLRQLHWLLVEYRIEFKILVLTFKALNDLEPLYLQDRLSRYTPRRPSTKAFSALAPNQIICVPCATCHSSAGHARQGCSARHLARDSNGHILLALLSSPYPLQGSSQDYWGISRPFLGQSLS